MQRRCRFAAHFELRIFQHDCLKEMGFGQRRLGYVKVQINDVQQRRNAEKRRPFFIFDFEKETFLRRLGQAGNRA